MDALTRYRAWIIMAVVLVVAILAVTFAAGTKKGSVRGSGDVPSVSFGSRVPGLGASHRLMQTNGWVATSGAQAIGVYAGAQHSNQRNGLFLIVRRTGGRRRLASVVVRGSGAVTLLRPASPASQQAAFTETLRFVTANGGTGTLDLSGDRVAVSG
ncbi:MAG TPA: hypothetical protein VHU61_04420 [Solirubrobacteraceae bacterium]|jgi:hypothetical protein|nr:hypothetical protein [Solirubrobacteraceae bacterium]